eukprot:SAG31_NODE_91_length_26366_cov_6.792211_12_plen_46_part_00
MYLKILIINSCQSRREVLRVVEQASTFCSTVSHFLRTKYLLVGGK